MNNLINIINELMFSYEKKCSLIEDIHFDKYFAINKIKVDTVKYKQLYS
jgi:hypothetical protein